MLSLPAGRDFVHGDVTLTVRTIQPSDLNKISEIIRNESENYLGSELKHVETIRPSSSRLVIYEFDERNHVSQVVARVGGTMIQSSNGKFIFREHAWDDLEAGVFDSIPDELLSELIQN